MEIKKYSFRDGFGWRVDPEVAGKRLDELAQETGGDLTPEMVVTDAENEDSPLHRCFDWDDKKAGDKWRLHQARQLIGSIVVDVVIKDTEQVRAFVNINYPDSKERHYVNIIDASTDEHKMKLIINDARKQMKSWAQRFKIYQQLREVALKVEELAETF
jgi:hypothetical protein